MDQSEPLENSQHEMFARYSASGMDAKSSYSKAYKIKPGPSAEQMGCRLSRKLKNRIQWLKKQSETAHTLTMQERREFLARVVRANFYDLDVKKDGDLVQSIERIDGSEGEAGILKMRLPGKRECIMDDAKLAGELLDKPSVAVNVSVNVLAPERQRELQKRKLESIERRRQARAMDN